MKKEQESLKASYSESMKMNKEQREEFERKDAERKAEMDKLVVQ